MKKLAAFASLVTALLFAWSGAIAAQERFAVQRVVDGDTVVLASIGTVRLIGIDTPESVDPREPVEAFSRESTAFLRSILQGRSVRVEYDQQRTDKYKRTLAYLYLDDGTFVNLEMVSRGYAHAYVNYPFKHMEQFRAAERSARNSSLGLWGALEAGGQSAVAKGNAPGRVWVNGASKVYHCPGTRYYGNTVSGEYMTESQAVQQGNHAAYGRQCDPSEPALPKAPSAALTADSTSRALQPDAGSAVKVWVNTSSGVYHCPDTRYYGTTKTGAYMSQAEAEAAGHRAAAGRRCS